MSSTGRHDGGDGHIKPHVTMLMETSLDGGLHGSRWTESPDGSRRDWSAAYEAAHDALDGDAWIVGRVTMAEMTKGAVLPDGGADRPPRPLHVARRGARPLAIALDPSGKLHFKDGAVNGDHAVVILGPDVPDSHLAALVAGGVSYVVAEDAEIDLAAALAVLGCEFGIRRLLLEGGAGVNGSFLAAGLVDEVHLLVAPAFDGDPEGQRIVAHPGGLAGSVRLRFAGVEPTAHGMVQLRYAAEPRG